MKNTTKLRRHLSTGKLLIVPGVADALNARLVRQHEFDAVYMTGAGTSAVRLGMPDIGLLTMTEMIDNAARIVDASGLPLIADADNGYGGVMNVRRAIQGYVRAGVAGVHLEDQAFPKRCGHLAGKAIVPVGEMVSKIKAAVDAREDPDFLLIARTDAIAVEGFDAAIERAHRYKEAGADALFIEAPNHEQLRLIPEQLPGPLLFNMASSGKTPFLEQGEIKALGFHIVIYPNWVVLAAIRAANHVLSMLKQDGNMGQLTREVATFREFFDILGMAEVQNLEARYQVEEGARVQY